MEEYTGPRRCDLCKYEKDAPCPGKGCNSVNKLKDFEPKGTQGDVATGKYKYKVTQPMLPPREFRRDKESPVMDERDMEYWLNSEDEQGWEFVSFGQKHWIGGHTQTWWIFRKPTDETK